MENGEWGIENGKLRMGNGELRMENGKWGMGNGEWRMENGELRMEEFLIQIIPYPPIVLLQKRQALLWENSALGSLG